MEKILQFWAVCLLALATTTLGLDYVVHPIEKVAGVLEQKLATSFQLVNEYGGEGYRRYWYEVVATEKQYNYHVSIERDGSQICSGAVIRPGNVVVTAATCGIKSTDIVRGGSGERLRGGIEARIQCIKTAPKRSDNVGVNRFDQDLALLHLDRSLVIENPGRYDTVITPVEIPSQNNFREGHSTGYTTTSIPDFRNVLSVAKLAIMPRRECEDIGFQLTQSMFCAGYLNFENEYCNEARANPLVSGGYLVGIASWGRGCSRVLLPSVYSDVASFYPWIQQVREEFRNNQC